MSIQAQRFLASVLVVLGLAYVATSWYTMHHRGSDGLSWVPPDERITQIDPAGPAARAGIAVGDRVDLLRADTATRFYETIAQNPPADVILSLPVIHHGAERVARIQTALAPSDPISPWKRPLSALLIVAAGILVLFRPQRATWAFLAYALFTVINLDNQYLPYPWQAGALAARALTNSMPPVALLLFAVWFLHGRQLRWHLPLTIVVVAFAAIAGALTAYQFFAPYFGNFSPALPFDNIRTAWDMIVSTVTLLVFIETFIAGRRENRQRIAWVIAAFTFAVVFQTIVPHFVDISGAATETWHAINIVAYILWSISPLVVAAALLYAMTRYRVVDLRIAISRALVYSITTFVIILVFALIEWAGNKLFEGSNVTAYAGIVAVLLIGFAANSLHRNIDALVDAIFFQRLRAAERRLRHLAAALLHTDAEETVAKFIVDEPARALDLASAALFLESTQSRGFVRVGSVGWADDDIADIARADEIVPQMRVVEKAAFVDTLTWSDYRLPRGIAAPLLAIPLKAHGDLFAIALYGGHSDGALLTTDERDLLALLTENAAAAYDHIEAMRTRKEIERLRADFARLQAGMVAD